MHARLTRHLLRAALALALAPVSCVYDGGSPSGPLQTESRSVPLGDAKSVRVEIKMGAGEIKLTGGARELLEAEFSYNRPRWKPEVDYRVAGGHGTLTIRQPEHTGGPVGPGRYVWDLRFNDKVPMELEVHLGAGKSDLILGSLSLTRLDLHMGVGETLVDLTGSWKNDLEARVHGGIGKATVRLPSDVGVRVRAKGGLGEIRAGTLKRQGDAYVNDACGRSPVTLNVDVEGGIGEINLELAEAPPVV